MLPNKSSVLAMSFRLPHDEGMICFVTGGSGFIGANLVHELNARGHRVRVLLRPDSDLRGLSGAEYEPVPGDLSDRQTLTRAMRGCDWCFHVAASYHLWLRDYAPMYAANGGRVQSDRLHQHRGLHRLAARDQRPHRTHR